MKTLDTPVTFTVSTSDTWETNDLTSYIGSDAVAVWIVVEGYTTSGNIYHGARRADHTSSTWAMYSYSSTRALTTLVMLDSSKQVQFYGKNATDSGGDPYQSKFHLIAYFTANDIAAYSSPTSDFVHTYTIPSGTNCELFDVSTKIPDSEAYAFVNQDFYFLGLGKTTCLLYRDSTASCGGTGYTSRMPGSRLVAVDTGDDINIYTYYVLG